VIGPFNVGPIYALFGAAAPFLIGACVTLPAAWLVRRVPPLPRDRTERHFDGLADDAHRVRWQRQFRGRPQHAPSRMSNEAPSTGTPPRGAQPSLAQARLRMGADVVQCEHTFTRVKIRISRPPMTQARILPAGHLGELSATLTVTWRC